ncbi:MAG: IS1595 family transposase [Treponema sp.]|nr:IS1595 family transposase [Treponema sp.]
MTATAAARIAGVNRNTANSYYRRIRELVFEESLKEAGREFGESYFGARRVRGKRGRGAAGKTPVFGLLKRGEKVYVKVVESCSRESLMPIIQGLTLEGSTIYTDGWKTYDGLIHNGYEHHRVSLETSLRIPPRERVRARQEPRQRHRELLELREGKARKVQRLQFRQICATLEGVRTRNEVSSGGATITGTRTCCL